MVEVVVGGVYDRGRAGFSAGFLSAISGIIILECDGLQRGAALFQCPAFESMIRCIFVVDVPGLSTSCFGFVLNVASGIITEGVFHEDGAACVFGGLA